jgi:hypothetical protein
VLRCAKFFRYITLGYGFVFRDMSRRRAMLFCKCEMPVGHGSPVSDGLVGAVGAAIGRHGVFCLEAAALREARRGEGIESR